MKKYLKRSLALCLTILMVVSICVPGVFAVENTNDASAEAPALSYVVVNSPTINAPEAEEILIGIGDEDTTIDSAMLAIRNQATGETAEYDATELTAGAALFCLDYTAKQTGAYELVSVRYTCDGVETEAVFADMGIQAAFGVNTEADSEPDAVVVDEGSTDSTETEESAPDVVVDVTRLNDGGDADVAAAVEGALYDAAADADDSNGIATFSMDGASIFSAQSNKTYVVVLDPGHGTRKTSSSPLDSGTSFTYSNRTYYEKDLTLKIAQYCKQELEKYANVKVYMTRTGDYNDVMSIEDRVKLANSYGADILVSFHLNSAGSGATTAKGAEVYYPNANGENGAISADAKKLSEQILNQLVAVGLTPHAGGLRIWNASEDKFEDGSAMDYLGINRYSKQYGFPGVLIEHAYLNNQNEFYSFLSDDSKLQKLGVADATGIANYLGLSKKSATTALTVWDGIDYSHVYDYDYYISHYPDVVESVGSDQKAVLKHFVEVGMKECRQASAEFDPVSYRLEYPELRKIYGNVWAGYYRHFTRWGAVAGLHGTGCTQMQGYVTKYSGDGLDYASVYDYNYYIAKYPEVFQRYGYDDAAVLKHFVEVGMKECRQASAEFDPVSYRMEYATLRQVYGNIWAGYYRHYVRWGKAAGLHGTGCTQQQGYVTRYSGDGLDYASVYDYNYYISKYPDVVKQCGYDETAVLKHFVEVGMKEHRQASVEFDPVSYRLEYGTLRQVYGDVWAGYYRHYVRWGKAAGLHGTGCTQLQGYVTKYSGDGLDYASVYDYNYYISKYPDVVQQCGYDDVAVLKHFVEVGLKEHRQGSAEFDPASYRMEYVALRQVYGNVWAGYYRHYIRWGKAAGLHGTGCTQMKDYVTKYSGDGLDYASVYDYNYYIAKYPDVFQRYGYDDAAVLKYFVENGLRQKQRGSAEFDVDFYSSTYAQFQSVYGTTWAGYYRHYIRWGKAAGFYGTDAVWHTIMRQATTSAAQMSRLLKSKNVSFDQKLYGMTMEQFCQLYVDECNAEGVDVSVAFCQAMLETGWLKYGGQVQASQFNFAGIKTADSSAFQTFNSVQEGIRAQVQHLKAYASKDALNNTCVDPRFKYVSRGTAPYVEWLCSANNPNGTGWTPDAGYSESILNFMNQLYKA